MIAIIIAGIVIAIIVNIINLVIGIIVIASLMRIIIINLNIIRGLSESCFAKKTIVSGLFITTIKIIIHCFNYY
jgi:hypothetical protein